MTETRIAMATGQSWLAWPVQRNDRLLRAVRFSVPQQLIRVYVGQQLVAAHPEAATGAPAELPKLPDVSAEWLPQELPLLMAGVHVSLEFKLGLACVVTFEHDERGGLNARA